MENIHQIEDSWLPVTFNPYKHHLGFLRREVEIWRNKEWTATEQDIRCIGNNLVDLYYGKLSVDEIIEELIVFAYTNDLTTSGKLVDWLGQPEYRKIKLSDGSFWVLKQGQDESRYLHIHPGKHSPFTIRVKASTLKTVVALKIFDDKLPLPDLSFVNKIRTEKLHLSPVKGLAEGKGIARFFANFSSI